MQVALYGMVRDTATAAQPAIGSLPSWNATVPVGITGELIVAV